MIIFDHLEELRLRLIYYGVCFILTFIATYYYSEQLFYLIAKPLLIILEKTDNNYLIYTNIKDAFFTYLNMSVMATIVYTLPFLVYQVWIFIKPGLFKYEIILLNRLIIFSLLLYCISLVVIYTIVLPTICDFFLGFQLAESSDLFHLHSQTTIDTYYKFVTTIYSMLIISFQFPIFMLVLFNLKMLNMNILTKGRRIIYFIFLIIGCLISPPEILSQLLIIGPIIILYEITLYSLLLQKNYSRITDNET